MAKPCAADEASLAVGEAIGSVKTGAGDKPVERVTIKKVTVATTERR